MPVPHLHVEEHGSGETVLLHQGLGQGSWAWRYQVPAFAQRFRTIVFDTRGTGRSPVPEHDYTIEDLAEDAAAILDGRAAHVVGFSMGGYVALTLALAHPELVRSLVLAGTGAGGPDRVPRPDHVRDAFERARTLPPEEAAPHDAAATRSRPAGRRRTRSASRRSSRRRSSTRPRSRRSTRTPPRATATTTSSTRSSASKRRRSSIHGTEDLIVPVENGRALARRLPNARYVELEGRGHNAMLEDPETFNTLVLGFLN